MEQLFTREQLARFGEYLLSDQRRELYSKTVDPLKTVDQRLRIVNHQDVENFISAEMAKELEAAKP